MEAFGVASGSVALIKLLGEGILSVKDLIKGARAADDSTRALGEEICAFEFSLSIIQHELLQGTLTVSLTSWWDAAQFDALLTNATKTFSRLQDIFKQIGRERRVLSGARSYYRSTRFEYEISHVRLRIKTYISSMCIPVMFMKVNTSIDQPTLLSHDALLSQLKQLEDSIQKLSRDTKRISRSADVLTPPESTVQEMEEPQESRNRPSTEFTNESEELLRIVGDLASNASNASRSDGTNASVRTMRPNSTGLAKQGTTATLERTETVSVRGPGLPAEDRARISGWITGTFQPNGSISSLRSRSFVSRRSSTVNTRLTPLSTIESQGEEDLDVELAKRRLQKVVILVDAQDYTKALPHVRRALEDMEQLGSIGKLDGLPLSQQHIEYLLATVLAKLPEADEEILAEAESHLRALVDSLDSVQQYFAAHLLATVLQRKTPPALEEAKDFCLAAIKGLIVHVGRHDARTYDSIALMAALCVKCQDSDASIWLEMLPDDTSRRNAVLSTLNVSDIGFELLDGAKLGSAIVSPDCQLIQYSVEQTFVIQPVDPSREALKKDWHTFTSPLCGQHHLCYPVIEFSPNAKLILVSQRQGQGAIGRLDVYRLEDQFTVFSWTSCGDDAHLVNYKISPDSKRLAYKLSSHRNLPTSRVKPSYKMFDLEAQRELFSTTRPDSTPSLPHYAEEKIVFSNNGSETFIYARNTPQSPTHDAKMGRIFDFETGEPRDDAEVDIWVMQVGLYSQLWSLETRGEYISKQNRAERVSGRAERRFTDFEMMEGRLLEYYSPNDAIKVIQVVFSTDDNLVAVLSELPLGQSNARCRQIELWEVKTRKLLTVGKGDSSEWIEDIRFTPDGKLLACIVKIERERFQGLRICDVQSKFAKARYTSANTISSRRIHPGHRPIVTRSPARERSSSEIPASPTPSPISNDGYLQVARQAYGSDTSSSSYSHSRNPSNNNNVRGTESVTLQPAARETQRGTRSRVLSQIAIGIGRRG